MKDHLIFFGKKKKQENCLFFFCRNILYPMNRMWSQTNRSHLVLCVQWMAGGSHGLSGRAVPKRAVVGVSKGTEFVTGPFPEGSRVRETEKRCGAAVRRDAQVSGRELIERDPSFSRFQSLVRPKLTGCTVKCKSGDSKNSIDKIEGAAGIVRNNQEKDYINTIQKKHTAHKVTYFEKCLDCLNCTTVLLLP